MRSTLTLLYNMHRFFSRNLLYPIAFSTLLVLFIWLARGLRISDWHYNFIPWNLFLAWIPYIFSLVVALLHARFPRQWWLLAVPFAFWLIFFPNAPYTVTDLLHLDEHPAVPFWYDTGLFVMFAWTGCFLAVVSLNIMQNVIRTYVGGIASWLFVCSAVLLGALGIYLGRFLYWNSWDLFFHPRAIILGVGLQLIHPIRSLQLYGFTFLFAAFLLVCYVTFVSLQKRERN